MEGVWWDEGWRGCGKMGDGGINRRSYCLHTNEHEKKYYR